MGERLELPWVAINNSVDIVDVASCGLIANVWARGENRGGPKAQEKAAFIVKACNSHDALVKALEDIASLKVTKGAAANLAQRTLAAAIWSAG